MNSLIEFESQQPFATRFFTEALSNNHLVNAYIMRGRDLGFIYRMILRLAQIMNCLQSESPLEACGQCQSCRWIEDNAHPGVITVSNQTYLMGYTPEAGPTVSGKSHQSIVVDQLNSLLYELGLHSQGFKRFVVVTGAQETILSEAETQDFTAPKDWVGGDGKRLQWLPLDRRTFTEQVSNKFLKTLEEPPREVIFFLLTDAEDKLLETIVSRCQTVPFSTPQDYYRLPLEATHEALFSQLLGELASGDCLTVTRQFLDQVNESGFTSGELLARFQQFVWQQQTRNGSSSQDFGHVKRELRLLEDARRRLQDRVKEEAVLEDMFLQLAGH